MTYKIFLAMAVADLAVSICLLMAVAVDKTALSYQGVYPLSLPQLFGEHHDLSTSCNDFASAQS